MATEDPTKLSIDLANSTNPTEAPALTPITPDGVTANVPEFTVPEVPQESFAPPVPEIPQDQLSTDLEKQAAQSEQAKEESLTDFTSAIFGTPGEAELTDAAFSVEGGVDDIQKEVNRLTADLMGEQRLLKTEIDRVNRNEEGLSSRAMQAERGRIQRESYSKQADIAVVQMAAQGRYDSARSIANRAVDVQLERDKRRTEGLRLIYEDNKDQFTLDEQRSFNLALSDRDRRLDQQASDKKTLQDVKLSALQMAQTNGAPVSVLEAIQNAQNPEEVLKVGGQWGAVDMLERSYKRQQIATSRTNQLLSLAAAGDRKAIEELGFDPTEKPEELDSTTKRKYSEVYDSTGDLLRLATEYKNIIDTKGFTNEIFGDSKVLGDIESLRAQMTAVYKDAKTLGTLDAGLLELMDQILGSKPTSSLFGIGEEGNIFANATGRRSSRISSSMQQLIDQTQLENARVAHSLGKNPYSNPLDLDLDNETAPVNNASTNPLGI